MIDELGSIEKNINKKSKFFNTKNTSFLRMIERSVLSKKEKVKVKKEKITKKKSEFDDLYNINLDVGDIIENTRKKNLR